MNAHRAGSTIAAALAAWTAAFAEPPASSQADHPASNDWAACGWDCTLFACADIDGDGFGDLLTINGNRDLCVAYGVHGWKASPWEVLVPAVEEGAQTMFGGDWLPDSPGNEVMVVMTDHVMIHGIYANGKMTRQTRIDLPAPCVAADDWALDRVVFGEKDGSRRWVFQAGAFVPFDPLVQSPIRGPMPESQPPPYEPAAALLTRFFGDLNGDGAADVFTAYSATIPHQHRVIRVAISPNAGSKDQDGDGLSDEEEKQIGSDPFDSDTDDDGLLDGWEVHGLPRGIPSGDGPAPNPLHQDVIVEVSRYEQIDQKALEGELPRVAGLYKTLPNRNPDGTTGIQLHFILLPPVAADKQRGGDWRAVGNEQLTPERRGLVHWLQVTPGGGGQSMQTGDMGGCALGWAVFAHEFGHQMSLSHEGDSPCAWCPLYPSLMNYAFSYSIGGDGNAVHFSDGTFRDTPLDESHLVERLPYPYEKLKYLEAGPFRFTLKADGPDSTLIDWNQNGRFDEGEVSADINYGGSTNGGVRRNHDLIGAQPMLCYVGGTCHLVTLDQSHAAVSIKNYLGDEKWTDRRAIPNSAADSEPVVLGLDDHGLAFFRRTDGWRVSRFTVEIAGEPVFLEGLPKCDLSVTRVNGRVLLVSRHDDDRLEARWLDWTDKPALTAPWDLELKSQVPVAMTQDPSDKRLLVVTSMPNSRGAKMCMRVTWFAPAGDRLAQQETLWTRGEGSGNNCSTRPVVSITGDGQLFIFHTGWPDGSGQMIAYRTRRIGNKSLDEGWLTCMMYDIWTRTRVGVAFADGPQGAIYAYRWDSGEYGETHVNHLQTAHNGLGIDPQPMRDFNDSAKMSLWGIRHSILNIRRDEPVKQ